MEPIYHFSSGRSIIRIATLVLIAASALLSSCNEENHVIDRDLTPYEAEVVEYFKEVALGFEYGNASEVTRKWSEDMYVYVSDAHSTGLAQELESIIEELNDLVTDGFHIEIVADSTVANFYVFLCSGQEYAEKYPDQANLTQSNWGLFTVSWNGNDELISGHMYVDIFRADSTERLHLLREEFTQSLGLARDSYAYPESIFQQAWTTTTAYAPIDREIISLLYDPGMRTGIDATEIDPVLKEILLRN